MTQPWLARPRWRMVALLLLLLTAPLRVAGSAASGSAAHGSPGAVAVPPPAALFWCVADVRPGETLLCALGQRLGQRLPIGTGNLALRIAPSGNATTALEAAATLSPSGDAVSAVVPAVAPAGAYVVQLLGDDGSELSETFLVNAPELWWAQGDRGAAASAGGWIRLFGRGLTLPRDERERERCNVPCELDGVVHALVQAREQEDVDWRLVASLAAQAERLATTQRLLQQQEESRGGGCGATTLNITADAPGSHSIVLQASARRLSTFSAEFVVPVATPPGNYSVSLSNGQAATGLSWFLSPQQPARNVIEIRAARQQSTRTFHVVDYGCAGGINRTNPKDLTSAEPVDCTAAINRALVAAAQHSPAPSTVLFGPGRWYLQPPLRLPDGVTIAGDSISTTALYFAQVSVNTSFANPPAGMPALIGPTESPAAAAAAAVGDGTRTSTTSFGIRDMCIYALSYYSTVINISASTSGVAVRRTRIRANAFNGRNGGTRRVPWQDTIGANGPPVILLQGTSSEIVDCDIYATWLAIASHGHYGPSSPAHSSRFTLIRNNTIWNGGACFWADQAKEVIFEGNTCSGISPMSGGNGIMTYGGG